MANSKSNYPAAQLGDLEPDFVSETIENLRQLNSKGKPKTDQELTERIDQYFHSFARIRETDQVLKVCVCLCVLQERRCLIGTMVLTVRKSVRRSL